MFWHLCLRQKKKKKKKKCFVILQQSSGCTPTPFLLQSPSFKGILQWIQVQRHYTTIFFKRKRRTCWGNLLCLLFHPVVGSEEHWIHSDEMILLTIMSPKVWGLSFQMVENLVIYQVSHLHRIKQQTLKNQMWGFKRDLYWTDTVLNVSCT